MGEGPPQPACGGRLQTTVSGMGQEPLSCALRKRHDRTCQVRDGETNESEPLMKRRKRRDDVKTGGSRCSGTSTGDIRLLPVRRPALRWRESVTGSCVQPGNLSPRCQGRSPSGGPTRTRVPMRGTGADQLVVAMKRRNGRGCEGVELSGLWQGSTRKGRSP